MEAAPTDTPPPSPWPARIAAALALAAGCAVVSPELGGIGGDDADYILLSRSLAGGAYETTWGAGAPTPHTLYPPLFPLLLLPFSGAAPGSFLGCHLPGLLLGAGAVLLLARLFERRGLPAWPAAAAALAPALSFFWLQVTADVLSELPFLFFAAADSSPWRRRGRSGCRGAGSRGRPGPRRRRSSRARRASRS